MAGAAQVALFVAAVSVLVAHIGQSRRGALNGKGIAHKRGLWSWSRRPAARIMSPREDDVVVASDCGEAIVASPHRCRIWFALKYRRRLWKTAKTQKIVDDVGFVMRLPVQCG